MDGELKPSVFAAIQMAIIIRASTAPAHPFRLGCLGIEDGISKEIIFQKNVSQL